jgi:NADPH:quinone reductase-like Zn-dependent oxidoreductase
LKVGDEVFYAGNITRPETNSELHAVDEPIIKKQHVLLNGVSDLIDDGTLISTVNSNLGKPSVKTLKGADAEQENGRAIGKNVLDGFR